MATAADRNLLFGILALHNGFISRDALIRAMSAWVTEKETPLGEVLVRQGDLPRDHHFLMEALVNAHLKQHNDDPGQSLAAISTTALVKVLADGCDDADLVASLGTHQPATAVRSAGPADPPSGDPLGVGTPTSSGRRFHIIRAHAEGGLGEVYLARDLELNREVALKQIKRQYCTDRVSQARFLAEAEITGGLEHPGVVPVYGLGHDEQRRPYYAMRFIKGESLKQAIDLFHRSDGADRDPGARALELRKLLGRFVDVCEAIAYAHSRGVVHRDIKPANVMLGKYGETLVVDWGLAKAVGRDDVGTQTSPGELTLRPSSGSGEAVTEAGAALGTPSFMSPEQAAGRTGDLGPSSDVYSLGATLYYLLTGRTPFAGVDIQRILWAVQRGEFPPPRQVNGKVPRALEAVCQKAMARHPADRFPSALALAEDVDNWLADEPVTAWREPFSIRARRSMRRHRTLVVSTVAVLVFGLAGLGGFATVLAGKNRELNRQRQRALDQRDRASAAERAARDLEAKTRKSEAETRTVLEFFRTKVLAAARPKDQEGGLGIDATIRAAVDASEPGIEKSFADQPTVEASIRDTLGESYMYLGEPSQAIRQLERALALLRQSQLAPDHFLTLDSMANLAQAYKDAGRLTDALPLVEETLKRFKAKYGPDHLDTLKAMNNVASAYRAAGRLGDAVSLFEQALEGYKTKLGPDDPETLLSMNNVATAYMTAGRLADALRLLEKALPVQRAKLGSGHPDTLITMGNLATAYKDAGRLTDALPLFEEALAGQQANLPADHPDTLMSRDELAAAYEVAGQFAKLEPLARAGLEWARRRFGMGDPRTAESMGYLGLCLVRLEKWPEAEPVLRECLSLREAAQPGAWTTFYTRSLLGAALLGQGHHAAAEPLVVSGYDGMKARELTIPARDRTSRLSEAAARVVRLYEAWGKPARAAEWREKLGLSDLPVDVFARP